MPNLAGLEAERRGKEEVILKLEQQLTMLGEDKKLHGARAEAAEQSVVALQQQRSEAAEVAVQQKDAAQADRQRLGDAVRKAEQTLGEARVALSCRAEFAEQRCKQLNEQVDAAVAERVQQRNMIVTLQEARAQISESLAVAQTEKRAAEELMRKAEERAVECAALKDGMVLQRNQARETEVTLRAEKRVGEELVARLEAQVAKLQKQMDVAIAKQSAAQEQLAAAQAQVRALEETLGARNLSISSLTEERAEGLASGCAAEAQAQARAAAADERCRVALAERENREEKAATLRAELSATQAVVRSERKKRSDLTAHCSALEMALDAASCGVLAGGRIRRA
jgi:hypothetical protein